MRAAIGFVLLAVLAVAGAWWLAGLPGSFTATISGTTLTTSTPVALLLLGVLFILIYAVLRLLAALLRAPLGLRRLRSQRQLRNGEKAVSRALLALAAGDAASARREADRGRSLLGATPLTLLLAAQASRQAGREEEAEATFKELAGRDDASFLGLRGLLQQATTRGDWAAATDLARRAEAAYPGAAWVKDERLQLALRSEQWGDALRLAPPAVAPALGTAAAMAATNPAEGLKLAKRAWEADPKLPAAAVECARRLREMGKERNAQSVLQQSWTTTLHPDVATAFLSGISDPRERLRAAPWLIRGAADHPESHLLLGRLSLEAGLPAEARRHAEAALAAGMKQRQVWRLFADISEAEGDQVGARDALRVAADADPDPTWRCEECGTPQAEWAPVCPSCATPGRMQWTSAQSRQMQLPRLAESKNVEGVL